MDLVIVGSIGYDDIETPEASGSDILGGSAVHAGVSASFHLPEVPGISPRVGLVSPVGRDFSETHQSMLEGLGNRLLGCSEASRKHIQMVWQVSGRYGTSRDNQHRGQRAW